VREDHAQRPEDILVWWCILVGFWEEVGKLLC
jgi:hypothetical protein